MSEAVRMVVKLSVNDGQQEEFKRLATELIETVEAKDPGCLQYDWFLSEDGQTCTVLEDYQNADALVAHVHIVGELIQATLQTAQPVSVDVYGDPTDELLALAGQFGATITPRWKAASREAE